MHLTWSNNTVITWRSEEHCRSLVLFSYWGNPVNLSRSSYSHGQSFFYVTCFNAGSLAIYLSCCSRDRQLGLPVSSTPGWGAAFFIAHYLSWGRLSRMSYPERSSSLFNPFCRLDYIFFCFLIFLLVFKYFTIYTFWFLVGSYGICTTCKEAFLPLGSGG